MSAGIEPPKGWAVGGWLLVGGEKMSKTTGNVVTPLELVDTVGVDGFRYYVLADTPVRPGRRLHATTASSAGTTPTWPTTSATSPPASPRWSARSAAASGRHRPPTARWRAAAADAVAGDHRRVGRRRPEPGARRHVAADPGDQRPPRGQRAVEAGSRAAGRRRAGRRPGGVADRRHPRRRRPSPARRRRSGSGSACPAAVLDARVPGDVAWGGYPGGLAVTKGPSLFPRISEPERCAVRWIDSHCHLPAEEADELVAEAARGRRRHDDHGGMRPGVVVGGAGRRHAPPRRARHRRPAPARGAPRRRVDRRPLRRAATVRSRWGSAASTTTTTTRPATQQREAFAAQIAIANERGAAARDPHPGGVGRHVRHPRRRGRARRAPIFHCFTGGPDEARRCLDRGAFVSFSGIVTFPGAADVREAAALVPLDRTLVETDSPYLAPVPNRGRAQPPGVGAPRRALGWPTSTASPSRRSATPPRRTRRGLPPRLPSIWAGIVATGDEDPAQIRW